MSRAWHRFGLRIEHDPIEAGREDVLYRAIAIRAQRQRSHARGFKPFTTEALTEPHQAKARAVALFRVGPAFEDLADESACRNQRSRYFQISTRGEQNRLSPASFGVRVDAFGEQQLNLLQVRGRSELPGLEVGA